MAGAKFTDMIRRADEVQRLGGGVYLADDFTGGLTTTGNIGDLGWQFLNGTAISHQAATASHSGVVRMDTSTHHRHPPILLGRRVGDHRAGPPRRLVAHVGHAADEHAPTPTP